MEHLSCYVYFCIVSSLPLLSAFLYPRQSSTRESRFLNGIWQFRTCPIETLDLGFQEKWYMQPLRKSGWSIEMPVPASYNDMTQNVSIRDFVGWVWYQREFLAPNSWNDERRVFIRFGSVNYKAVVYLNSENIVNHTGGHLPFEVEITPHVHYYKKNMLTVAVSNILSNETIPQGQLTLMTDTTRYPENFYKFSYAFDFFHYCGIHRDVIIHTTNQYYVKDISIVTTIQGNVNGLVTFTVDYEPPSNDDPICLVSLLDAESNIVAETRGCKGQLKVASAHFWWPVGMSNETAYLYTFKVVLIPQSGPVDEYLLPVGIRTVQIQNNRFLINGKPFYFMGFGKHEDAHIRGRGYDRCILVKDMNLMQWMGANCFRTSHYPYSEQMMNLADVRGIVVIDESPSVAQERFDSVLLALHLKIMEELIERDKNHPCVVMWSLANEPKSSLIESKPYFKALAEYTKYLDPTRPITIASNIHPTQDRVGYYLDCLLYNKYYAWYEDLQELDVIEKPLLKFMDYSFQIFKKPVMMAEYGADTIPGYHMHPTEIFTEDFQCDFLRKYHDAFDKIIPKGYFIGEMIWNFADFNTAPSLRRVVGNKKGVFTRERQPKAAARVLRCRYLSLANASVTNDDFCCPRSKLNQ